MIYIIHDLHDPFIAIGFDLHGHGVGTTVHSIHSVMMMIMNMIHRLHYYFFDSTHYQIAL